MNSIPKPRDQDYQALITAKVVELRKLPCFRTNGHGAKERPYDVSGPPRRTFDAFMASFDRKPKGARR